MPHPAAVRFERWFESGLNVLKRAEAKWHQKDYLRLETSRTRLRAVGIAPWEGIPVPDMQQVKNLLIYKPDEIGDAVLSLPAISALRRAFAKAHFSLLCQKTTHGFFQRTDLFDEIVWVKKSKVSRFASIDLERALAEFSVREFDAAIFLRTYPAYFSQFLKIPAKNFIHPLDPRMASHSAYRYPVSTWGNDRKHQVIQNLELVSPLVGRDLTNEKVVFPSLRWRQDDLRATTVAFGSEPPNRYIVVHPYARHETRQYPVSYFRELCSRLHSVVPVVIVGLAGDKRLELDGITQLQGRLTLTQLAYLIARSAGFTGVESGPAHIAGMLGVPTVTLFGGHSHLVEWAPVGDGLNLGHSTPCAPCYRRFCPGLGVACLTRLEPEEIFSSIERFFMNRWRGGETSVSGERSP